MNRAYPELTDALSRMLDQIDAVIRASSYQGPPIRMVLAGGLALNFYCGSRYTEDVDASFSRRVLLPYADLVIDYRRSDGTPSFIYFDQNYSPSLSLLHEDYENDAQKWEGIGNEHRLIHLWVLAPLDLALSKVSRFTEQDQEDIMTLARHRFFTANELKHRAEQALAYYVGNTESVRRCVDLMCNRMEKETRGPR